MSETTTESTTQAPEAGEKTQGDPADTPLGEGGKKALDAERNARTAAEKKAGELQKQLDAFAQANESAIEKAQREASEAKEAATKATAEAFREAAVTFGGISAEDADLFLTGSDRETLQKQAARLVERTSTTTTPKPDLSQGGRGGESKRSTADLFAEAVEDSFTR